MVRSVAVLTFMYALAGCGQGLKHIAFEPETADLRSEQAFDPAAFDFDPRLRPLAAEVAISQIKDSGLLQPFPTSEVSEKFLDEEAQDCHKNLWDVSQGDDGMYTIRSRANQKACSNIELAKEPSEQIVIQQYCSEASLTEIIAALPSDHQTPLYHSLCLDDSYQAYRIHRESRVSVNSIESTTTTIMRRNVMSPNGGFCEINVNEKEQRHLTACGEYQRIVSKTIHQGRAAEIKSDLLQKIETKKLEASKDALRYEVGELALKINQWLGNLTLVISEPSQYYLEERDTDNHLSGVVD